MSEGSFRAERRKGYSRFAGTRVIQAGVSLRIAAHTLRTLLKGRFVKAACIGSLVPGVVLGALTYLFIPLSDRVLSTLLVYEGFFLFLVGALAGSRIVSDDRSRGAFLVYFSRPVRKADYVLGKYLALFLLLFLVAVVPALFVVASDLAIDQESYLERNRAQGIPPEFTIRADPQGAVRSILLWGVVVAGTEAALLLGLSSLFVRSKDVAIAWAGIVLGGGVASSILEGTLQKGWPTLLSWTVYLNEIQRWFLGVPLANDDVDPVLRLLLLGGVSVGALLWVPRALRWEGTTL